MLKKVMADKLWRGVRQALPDGAVEGGGVRVRGGRVLGEIRQTGSDGAVEEWRVRSERRWVLGKYVWRCLTGWWRQEGCWEGLGSGGVRSAAIR